MNPERTGSRVRVRRAIGVEEGAGVGTRRAVASYVWMAGWTG